MLMGHKHSRAFSHKGGSEYSGKEFLVADSLESNKGSLTFLPKIVSGQTKNALRGILARSRVRGGLIYFHASAITFCKPERSLQRRSLQVVTELVSQIPKPRIIVMTTYEGEENVRRALSAGANGYAYLMEFQVPFERYSSASVSPSTLR